MTDLANAPHVNCPNCNKEVQWHSSSLSRPFCSERCRLIDLGDWIEEKNTIPSQPEEEITAY